MNTDTRDAIAAYMRTAHVLANSGVNPLDTAAALVTVLIGVVSCLPPGAQGLARARYAELVRTTTC